MRRTAYITVRMDATGENEKTIRAFIKENFGCLRVSASLHSFDNPKLGNIRLVRPSHRAKKVKT